MRAHDLAEANALTHPMSPEMSEPSELIEAPQLETALVTTDAQAPSFLSSVLRWRWPILCSTLWIQ